MSESESRASIRRDIKLLDEKVKEEERKLKAAQDKARMLKDRAEAMLRDPSTSASEKAEIRALIAANYTDAKED